ncbi:MAG: 3-dehydroquinate synthase [Phycisphaerae bacterium]
MTKTIRIDLGDRSYDVQIGPGLRKQAGSFLQVAGHVSSVAVISDSNVSSLYGQDVLHALSAAGYPASLLTFPAGENHKTLATCGDLYDRLFSLQPAMDRSSVIVALGGGVTGDMAGFVAATFLRGIRFVQVPTSLLADVDASAGGKTGIDHPAGKNLIGAFHQPAGVLVDVDTLKTLPAEELRSGLAECVKHAVIRDADLLDYIESRASDLLACEEGSLSELIARNVAIKAAVVSQDEREAGLRAILNYGHTFGHAIEAAAGFGNITHGQAVALGMVAANSVAVARDWLDAADADRVEAVLVQLGLETRRAGLDAIDLHRRMLHDKKTRDGKIKFLLPTRLGEVRIVDDLSEAEIYAGIGYLQQG